MMATTPLEIPSTFDASWILARYEGEKLEIRQGRMRALHASRSGLVPTAKPLQDGWYRIRFVRPPSSKRRALDEERDSRKGCLILRRSKQSGTIVGLYRSRDADLDDDDGALPYTTSCDDHGYLVSHETRRVAEAHLADPKGWCPGCRGEDTEDS